MSLPTLSKNEKKGQWGESEDKCLRLSHHERGLEEKRRKFQEKGKRREGEGVEEEEWLKRVFQPIEISRCLFQVRWKSAKGPNEDAECNPDECNSSESNSSEYGAEAGRAQENYDQFQISNAMS